MEIVDRVEVVKNEHEKLEGGNKFLQSWVSRTFGLLFSLLTWCSYIGELMQTSKLTSAGAAKSKNKGKGRIIK